MARELFLTFSASQSTDAIPELVFIRFFDAMQASIGENTRWLADNAAIGTRAYADMMAEKAAQSNNGAVK